MVYQEVSAHPSDALWTFPLIIGAAIFIAWAAEAAQYRIAQGLALAMLALVQTLPEYAVETAIAWSAGKDPRWISLMTANFTGALRLLVGLGWPLIFVTATICCRVRNGHWLAQIDLKPHHAAEVIAMVPPAIYLLTVPVLLGRLTLLDGAILASLYLFYVWLMWLQPSEEVEDVSKIEPIPRFILTRKTPWPALIIIGLFVLGAIILVLFAHPFVESMVALAMWLGVPSFFMVQWVAPLLSEFPEKVSAFYWARKIESAPTAVMNMASSAINELTLLVALMPAVFCLSKGMVEAIPLDAHQRAEILFTATTALLGAAVLADHTFKWWEALGIFVLWTIGFAGPMFVGRENPIWSRWLHEGLTVVNLAWIAIEAGLVAWGVKRWVAVGAFAQLIRDGRNSRNRR